MASGKRFSDAAIKIERAKQHIIDLERMIGEFKANRHRFIRKDNHKTGEREFSFRGVDVVSPDIPLRTGEILQNLRSALDYAVCALVVNNGGIETTHTGFPIFSDADEYKRRHVRKVQGMRHEAMEAIHAIKPYKCNGMSDLWVLRSLNDRDKHRILLTTAVAFKASRLTPTLDIMWPMSLRNPLGFGPAVDVDVTPADGTFPLKNGAIFFAQPLKTKDDPKFTFDIAFNEPEILHGDAILPTVQQFSDLVERIVETLSKFIV